MIPEEFIALNTYINDGEVIILSELNSQLNEKTNIKSVQGKYQKGKNKNKIKNSRD